jgi:hypothetical protein
MQRRDKRKGGFRKQPLGDLDEFFVGVEAAVFGGVVERDVAVCSLFELVDFAGVEGF